MHQSTFQSWKNWLLVAVSLVCLVLLFYGGPQRYVQRSHEYAWGLGHVLCFAVWTILFLKLCDGWSYLRQCVVIVGLTLFLGFGIEFLQAELGRSFDLADVLNNLAGSLLALAFFSPARRGLLISRRFLIQIVALLVLMVVLFPLGRALFDEYLSIKQFPVLSDFETPLELERWTGNARLSMTQDFVTHGRYSLKAELTSDQYSGFFLRFFPNDWRGFQQITFDLYNPSSLPQQVTCRVHDRFHTDSGNAYSDRFNQTFIIDSGWTQIDLPLEQIARAPQSRNLDLGLVAGLGIFVTEQKEPKILYLDHVRLRR